MTSTKFITVILSVGFIYCGTAFAEDKVKTISPPPYTKPDVHILKPCEKSPSWRTDGNCGTAPGFLGTSGDAPLIIKTRDSERMRIRSTGETMVRSLWIGYGDVTPSIHFYDPISKTSSASLIVNAPGVLSVYGDLKLASNGGIIFPDGKVKTRAELIGEKGSQGEPGKPGAPGHDGKDGAAGKDGTGIDSATYSTGVLTFKLTNGKTLKVTIRTQCECSWGVHESISGGGTTICSSTGKGAGEGPADNIEQCTNAAQKASGIACDIKCI